ncbi:helix-turn-helix domain-containing protein [Micromonospora peucetia]|uniref:Helix-turn-helix domain-containing protein n=1 Tax=Micromonospora peucetia TaxID=47871 RepID=A0A1C6W430_9ACTN|nr:helix-turn-helix transcriptional regulator [Micromonospora peucetia]MCX4391279.1 helix-turn-helix domain-containing protein [Micromonospora peucetia]SCL72940.1 Helix-turn-helix domain-containing protein [Micromonospora peucetia]
MAEDPGSTVPRRQLGRALRELRNEAGMTLDGVAGALRCNRQKVQRIEGGIGAVGKADVQAMCKLYGAASELAGALIGLARQTKEKGWWHAYGVAVPDWFDLHGGLESAACRLREYHGMLVPALLQTRAYASAVCLHRPGVTADERDRLVEARVQRQSLLRLRLPPLPRFEVVLSEAVLLRVVGDAATMTDQLRHLLDAGRLPHVSIRVLPLAAGLHVGAGAGAFVLLDFSVGNRVEPEPPVVYSESLTGALYLDRPWELAAYEKIWTSLDALALDEEESRRLIIKVSEEAYVLAADDGCRVSDSW